MTTPYDETFPMRVHVVKDDTKSTAKPIKQIVTSCNSFLLTLGSIPQMIMGHTPKRVHAHIVVNGTGIVAFGRSQSDCQSAANNPATNASNVTYVNGAEFVAALPVLGDSEIWAVLVATSDPAPVITQPAISQPAVPASGVAQQNLNNAPVTVVISPNGATITNVTVNGVTVGTGAGTYIVPPAGTISIAYTVATPTWVWSLTPAPITTTVIPTVIGVIKEVEC